MLKKESARRLLFFGELPPRTNHGTSISSNINLMLLKTELQVDIVEEYSDLKFHERFSFNKLSTFLRAYSLFYRTLNHNKYDYFYGVLYLSFFGIIKNFLTIMLFKRKNNNAEILLHVHRSDFDNFYKKKVNRFFFNRVLKRTNKFLVLAKQQEADFVIDKAKKKVLYNTIEQEHNIEPREYAEQHTFQGIVISNYIPAKGWDDLLEALSLFDSSAITRLSCYGNPSDTTFIDELMNKAIEIKNININHAITGTAKYLKLCEADFFILPSHNEGFPLVLLEAMSVGLPIITTKVGYIEEMLGKDYPFYCEAQNAKSLALAIEKFINYKEKNKLSLDLKNKYDKYFSNFAHKDALFNIFGLK